MNFTIFPVHLAAALLFSLIVNADTDISKKEENKAVTNSKYGVTIFDLFELLNHPTHNNLHKLVKRSNQLHVREIHSVHSTDFPRVVKRRRLVKRYTGSPTIYSSHNPHSPSNYSQPAQATYIQSPDHAPTSYTHSPAPAPSTYTHSHAPSTYTHSPAPAPSTYTQSPAPAPSTYTQSHYAAPSPYTHSPAPEPQPYTHSHSYTHSTQSYTADSPPSTSNYNVDSQYSYGEQSSFQPYPTVNSKYTGPTAYIPDYDGVPNGYYNVQSSYYDSPVQYSGNNNYHPDPYAPASAASPISYDYQDLSYYNSSAPEIPFPYNLYSNPYLAGPYQTPYENQLFKDYSDDEYPYIEINYPYRPSGYIDAPQYYSNYNPNPVAPSTVTDDGGFGGTDIPSAPVITDYYPPNPNPPVYAPIPYNPPFPHAPSTFVHHSYAPKPLEYKGTRGSRKHKYRESREVKAKNPGKPYRFY